MAGRSSAGTVPTGQAPGDLEKIRAFVNTRDIEQGTDALTSPATLASWLAAGDLTGDDPAREVTDADLTRALRLREALRVALQSHVPPGRGHGAPIAEPAPELREIAADLPIRLEIDEDGRVRAVADGGGGPAALARLLLIMAEAATLGTWTRLKVCSADDCRWAFYDRSPTRSGSWCSMQGCGSRAKSRAYRRRAAPSPGTQTPAANPGPASRGTASRSAATASRSGRSAAPGA
jgi:predicted RNA-binding Zn ribbon-like protein